MKVIITAVVSAALVASVFAVPAISSRQEQSKSIPARIRALERNVRVLKAQLASTRATADSAQAVAHTAQTVADNLDRCLGQTLAVSPIHIDGVMSAPGGFHTWSNPADGGALVPSSFSGFSSAIVTYLTPHVGMGVNYYVALVESSCSNGFR